MEPTDLSCRLALTESTNGELLLGFEVVNDGEREASLDSYSPFLDFELHVRVGESELEIVQPQLDTPVEPRALKVPAHGKVALTTPIRVAFDAAVPPGGGPDPWRWSIRAARAASVFEVTLVFGGRRVGPCRADFKP